MGLAETQKPHEPMKLDEARHSSGSALNNLVMPDYEAIYLVPTDDGFDWCCDPAPGEGMNAEDSVKYIRATEAEDMLLNAFQIVKNGKQIGYLKFDEFKTLMRKKHNSKGNVEA